MFAPMTVSYFCKNYREQSKEFYDSIRDFLDTLIAESLESGSQGIIRIGVTFLFT